MQLVFTILTQFVVGVALASGGGHQAQGIPWNLILSQVINLGALGLIIYFSAGKTISDYFKAQKVDFLAQVESASKAVAVAKKHKDEISREYSKLKANWDLDLKEAAARAQELYREQISDARNQALKLAEDSRKALSAELEKAIENLRVETYFQSAELAEKNLGTTLTKDQQKAWNKSFPDRLKAGVH